MVKDATFGKWHQRVQLRLICLPKSLRLQRCPDPLLGFYWLWTRRNPSSCQQIEPCQGERQRSSNPIYHMPGQRGWGWEWHRAPLLPADSSWAKSLIEAGCKINLLMGTHKDFEFRKEGGHIHWALPGEAAGTLAFELKSVGTSKAELCAYIISHYYTNPRCPVWPKSTWHCHLSTDFSLPSSFPLPFLSSFSQPNSTQIHCYPNVEEAKYMFWKYL